MNKLDSFFPYPTPKIARIKDWRLGLLRTALFAIIFVYVVFYQIMWRGNHLETKDLAGVYQLQLDHPTQNNCDPINIECRQNFTSLSALQYCSQSPASSSIKLPCQYLDAPQLGQVTDQGLLIPTHISTYFQRPGCKPKVENNWTCDGWLYDFLDKKGEKQPKTGQPSPIEDFFVADIEKFTLMIDHSVRAVGHRFYASDMVGYWLDCEHEHQADHGCTPRPIQCESKKCHGQKQHLAEGAETGIGRSKFRGDRRSLSLATTRNEARPHRSRILKEISAHNASVDPVEADSEAEDDEDEENEIDSTTNLQLEKEKGQELEPTTDSEPFAPARPPKIDPESYAPARSKHLSSLGVASLDQGDLFSISMLLKAANVSLDKRRHHVPAWVGGSYRSSGFVLVIRIHYTNIESWLGLKVLPWRVEGPAMHYTYRITKHASHDDFMLRQVLVDIPTREVQDGDATHPEIPRVLKEYHGIRVLIEQSGSVAVWDNIQLLLILTTTLALMAVSNCITETVALHCLPHSDEYWAIKFEPARSNKAAAELDPEAGEDAPGTWTMSGK